VAADWTHLQEATVFTQGLAHRVSRDPCESGIGISVTGAKVIIKHQDSMKGCAHCTGNWPLSIFYHSHERHVWRWAVCNGHTLCEHADSFVSKEKQIVLPPRDVDDVIPMWWCGGALHACKSYQKWLVTGGLVTTRLTWGGSIGLTHLLRMLLLLLDPMLLELLLS